jgi:hypothetical protein
MAGCENIYVRAIRANARFIALLFQTTGLVGIDVRMAEMSRH